MSYKIAFQDMGLFKNYTILEKATQLYSPSLAKEAHEPVQTKLSSVFSWLTTFLAAWLGYAKLGPFSAFNNYVDQI